MHSTASDGTVSPTEVVRLAAAAGLVGISLTDHDTVRGQEEAAEAAARAGLAYLVGAELSANVPGRSVHLLAFGFDLTDREFLRFLERYDEDRRRRARKIVQRLRQLGLDIAMRDVDEQARGAAPTRAHIARALVSTGMLADEEAVFGRYLGWRKPAFVEKSVNPPREVIARVHAVGGVVILAHPGRAQNESSVRALVTDGLDGVEIMHPSNAHDTRKRMSKLVNRLGLLPSGGSDWHGPGTRRARMGVEPVPEAWMEAIAGRAAAAV